MIKVDVVMAFDHLYRLANEEIVSLADRYPALLIEEIESKRISISLPEEVRRFVGDISLSCVYKNGSFNIQTHPDIDGGKLSILQDWMKGNKEYVIKYTIEVLFDAVYKIYTPIHFTDVFKSFFDTYRLYKNFYSVPMPDKIDSYR
jgi:hypothetical protein